MDISVLVATRNNSAPLARLLENLLVCKQPEVWELFIVDNGSVDETADVIQRYTGKLPIKYLYSAAAGKSRALNHALSHLSGKIFLFTDDDVIPDPDWLINHVRVMDEHPEINIVGGRIRIDRTALPAWLANSYNLTGMLVTEHDLGDSEMIYPFGRIPYGPNMSVRGPVVRTTNKSWPEDIGPGTSLPVGDEMLFVSCVSKPHERLYSPDCRVEHRPVIGKNYFVKSLRRCFSGGYAAGYYGETPAYTGESAGRLIMKRISTSGSVREFCCIVVRACGFYIGKFRQRFA